MLDSRTSALDDASELWQAIVQGAGLDLERYDEQLIKELSKNLGISSKNFERELDRAGVTAATLLNQFLHLIAPYAVMMQDILAFFARAGAQSSVENLRVRFDFDNMTDSFEFDLRNFRDWEIQFTEGLAKILGDDIDDLLSLQLRHAFMAQGVTYQIVGTTWSDLVPSDVDVSRWLIQSETDIAVLVALPPPPSVHHAELSALLARVWRFLRTSAFRMVSDVEAQALSPDDIRMIVRGAYLLQGEEDLLLKQLNEVFIHISEERKTSVLIEQLFEVFNFPVWKRRSELYSVWVGAQLITGFGEGVRIHVVDRSIVFSFGGAHLATVRLSPEENLHVWCELRTKGSALLGKGRKRAIQPDYVILREPTTHPNSAVLVVECKQYLQQARRGFAEALIDYANGHRRAEVVLVNYGPATSSILERVAKADSSLLTRTRVIGKLRPGSPNAIGEFGELIRSVASRVSPPAEWVAEKGVGSPELDTDIDPYAGNLRLSWKTSVDLDIHCWITDTKGDRQHVYFACKLGDLGGSRIELDKDVRVGGEVEILAWENVESVCLDFAVHAFSRGSDIVQAQPRLEVNACGSNWIIQPPEGQRGSWWKLFRIGVGGSPITIWNSIVSEVSFPEESDAPIDRR